MLNKKYKYGQSGKKIIFYDSDKRHAELIIRLRHDGLTQSAFFQSIITGYLEKDERIIDFIHHMKFSISNQGKSKINKTKQLIEEGYELENMFNLTEKERDKIFDLIAQEHGEV